MAVVGIIGILAPLHRLPIRTARCELVSLKSTRLFSAHKHHGSAPVIRRVLQPFRHRDHRDENDLQWDISGRWKQS